MGNSHSLNCGKTHIYDKIKDKDNKESSESHKSMGDRKDSLVTLDIKIGDLDDSDVADSFEEATNEIRKSASQEWLQESGWGQNQNQFRKREDILYNIFMIETEDTVQYDLPKSKEPNYGRMASLDVSLFNVRNENNMF